MRTREDRRKSEERIDPVVLVLVLTMVLVGFLVKVQATPAQTLEDINLFDFSSAISKQFLWTIAAGVIIISLFVIEKTFWSLFSIPTYFITVLMLILVLFIGKEINGSKSWFVIGGFSFQPSELAKFGTALALSNVLSINKFTLDNWRNLLLVTGIIATPMFLILLQPDAGSAIVFTSFVIVLYREGMPAWPVYTAIFLATIFVLTLVFGTAITMIIFMLLAILMFIMELNPRKYWIVGWVSLAILSYSLLRHDHMIWVLVTDALILLIMMGFYFQGGRLRELTVIGALGMVAGLFSWGTAGLFASLRPHQQARINAWLNPSKCDWDTIYNVMLSKMAISSGGITGKGFLNGSLTKLNFVPEHTTDFIFCVVGEEFGLMGALFVLGSFAVLIMRILYLAELQKLSFARSYFYAVAGILFVHVLINIGMTLGLMPVIGIPLPFFSYGGSSIIGFSLMLGVLMKLDNRKIAY